MKKKISILILVIILIVINCHYTWSDIPVVITAAKKEQKQSETTAATFVITSGDIRRSGARTIPDLLRMVPGIHVARMDANKWAISLHEVSMAALPISSW